MIKQFKFNKEVRKSISNGINVLANAVKVTLGPKGKCVIIGDNNNNPRVTKDGVSVAKEVYLKNPFENLGAQLMKEVAIKTLNTVGDSTTTSTILAQSIINQGFKIFEKRNIDHVDLIEGIKSAVNDSIEFIKSTTIPITPSDIKNISTISSNNDPLLGNLIGSTFEKIGKNGVISIEDSSNSETSVKIINGMQFDKGYESQHFVTNIEKDICELTNPYILITEQKINDIKDIAFILNQVASEHKSLLLIAGDFDDSVLETLKFNKLEGVLKVCAVKAPSFGEYRKAILNDIACLTKGTNISYESNMLLKDAPFNFLGTCKKINISKTSTTLIDGSNSKSNINKYVKILENELSQIKNDPTKDNSFMINFLKERIAKLTGGIAVLYVGGTTEAEMKEKKDRVEDAVAATKVAIEEGVVIGGGVTYYNASKILNDHINKKSKSYNLGRTIIKNALLEPFNILITNAGYSPNKFYNKISKTEGININTGEIVDMYKSGIIDPSKAARLALENASSISILFLSTECMIVPETINFIN